MGLAAALAKEGMTNAVQQDVTDFISTGYPPLDKRLGGSYRNGGFPQGRIIEMFGPPSAGKTAIATMAMVAAQKAGGMAMFQDHENSFDIKLARGFGLNDDPDYWVYNKPDTFEQSVDQMQTLMETSRGLAFKGGKFVSSGGEVYFPNDKPIVAVFDSLAGMVPQSVFTDSKGKARDAADRNMNDTTSLARATSSHFPKLALLAERGNVTIIFLNQIRTKMGVMYGDPTTSPGGDAPKFWASVRLKLGRAMITEGEGADRRTVGQKIGAETVKNKVRAPFQKASWDFLFQEDGTGKFDVTGGVIEELVSLGLIERTGAYTTWKGKKWHKKALVAHIETSGEYPELLAMFPN